MTVQCTVYSVRFTLRTALLKCGERYGTERNTVRRVIVSMHGLPVGTGVEVSK